MRNTLNIETSPKPAAGTLELVYKWKTTVNLAVLSVAYGDYPAHRAFKEAAWQQQSGPEQAPAIVVSMRPGKAA